MCALSVSLPYSVPTSSTDHDSEFPVSTLEQVTASQPRRFHTPEQHATQPPQVQPSHSSSSQTQPVYFHTPATKLKAAVSGAFRSASNLQGRRIIIVDRDVPKMIPEIFLQDYLDHVWPSLPQSLDNQTDSILRILEDNATIDVSNDRWVAFPVDPANANRGEVFQGLTTIFNAVTAAAKQIDSSLEQTFSLIINGNVAMYSDRGASSRPNGFTTKDQKQTERKEAGDISKAKNKRCSVYDLANPHQFKLRDRQNDEDDVRIGLYFCSISL
ncbi:hypothetical protein DFH05DRAFT_477614 [Lentinula detonsa]|uniref:Uncharacterized protein n=1 Tax=Lentinula detonsa TaxID=2804962 RepID=A0A9W8TU43_9AGAR|nr:hypothetical protein DFH05DRAFT_477614 [Lentinula detonsa]